MSLWTKVVNYHDELVADADPRAVTYPFMDSLVPNTVSIVAYLFIVLYAGPRFMRDRKPFDLKYVMILYNLFMVLFSAWMCYEFLVCGWLFDYSLTCQEVEFESTSPKQLRMVRVCYLYFLSKHIEFLDTFFFILRKKSNQVTFLHVFHHSGMAYGWWFGANFSAGGLGTFHAPINCLVHVMMYSYYGIAAMGPRFHKYIWWKKHLTSMQLIQFALTIGHLGNVMLFHNCRYPIGLKYLVLLNGSTLAALFVNFYRQTYIKKAQLKRDQQNGKALSGTNGHAAGKPLKGD
uniref:Elongation of very long chain fatty acids protein n=1 Tax=Phallusia mammillata TaxID=59560 RepID=A0A6F9DCP3_9ASCI|nr:elongation of very long chain fatty acids protein 7-like [Phallusia mammillata]